MKLQLIRCVLPIELHPDRVFAGLCGVRNGIELLGHLAGIPDRQLRVVVPAQNIAAVLFVRHYRDIVGAGQHQALSRVVQGK